MILLDATRYVNKPKGLAAKFIPTLINGHWSVWDVTFKADGTVATELPTVEGGVSESGNRYLPNLAASMGAKYLILDIEGANAPEVGTGPASTAIGWCREEMKKFPGMQLGVWAMPKAVNGLTCDAARISRTWNTSLLELCDLVDLLCPAIYPYEGPNYIDQWVKDMAWSIHEARSTCPDKPLYPCLCPKTTSSWAMIPNAQWKAMLAAVKKGGADGVVIWDPDYQTDWKVAKNSWWPAVEAACR